MELKGSLAQVTHIFFPLVLPKRDCGHSTAVVIICNRDDKRRQMRIV